MSYRSVAVRDARLASVVDRVWACEVADADGYEEVLPNGCAQLVIGLDPAHPAAILQGPTTRRHTIDRAVQRRAIGLSLRSGGLHALTGEDVSAFADRTTVLGDVLRLDVAGLVEELRAAPTIDEATTTLARALTETMMVHGPGRSVEVGRAVDLFDHREAATVGAACEALGVRRARLAAAFRVEVGMSPKRYARLRRFEAAVAAVRCADAPPLVDVAVDLGYADQAHLTRDFAEFAGRTPGSLHRIGARWSNHLPDRPATSEPR